MIRIEIRLRRDYDDLNPDGTRESHKIFKAIASVCPEAIWEKQEEDSWKILI